MIGKRIVFSLFPRPRKPIRFRDALPLVMFLLVFAGTCVGLEWFDVLLFERPAAFGLTVFTFWIWWMYAAGLGGLSPARGVAALVTRLVFAGLLIMLLAQPRAVRTSDVLSVIYALDISDSVKESVDEGLSFVAKTIAQKPGKDEAGLVVFGRNSSVELPPRKSVPLEAANVINSLIDRDATNLEEALSLAGAMLPEEHQGRIVLLSDGTQTRGSLSSVLDELQSRDISVDVLPIEYQYDREVWLERLELPRLIKMGENYEASVVLSSLTAGEGRLVLQENGQQIFSQNVSFDAGKNRYTVPIQLREPGYYEYTATIQVPSGEDHIRENNRVLDYLYIEGEGKVLLVTDPQGDERDWKPLAGALREGERAVEVASAYQFARDSLSLLPYDAIVFVNAPADAFDAVQLQAVHDAVYDLGIGFLMVGGENSFGPGGYHRTLVEKALPVSMDVTRKKILPKGALAIILHTCEFPEGNTWGKRITKKAIQVLGARDEVGVLVYGQGGEQWLFELTPAGEYQKLVKKINAAVIGDMPTFGTTMQMGLQGLKQSDAATKHMIIISDGDPSPPPPNLMQQFIENKVSVTMVAIYPHEGRAGSDIPKMRSIAGATGGRFYFPADANQLPAIFIKEAKTLKRSMIQNETVQPEVGFPSPVLKGIDALPPLHGYVLTTGKPAPARTVLQVTPDGESADQTDPILAVGRYGLGTTAAFTSDLSSNWGADWVESDHYRPFVNQLLTKISRVEKQGHLRMWTHTSGNEGVIVAEDFHPEERFLDVRALVSGPGGREKTVRLKQVAPRRYQATVPLWGKGRYQVIAEGEGGGETERAQGGLIVPYSPEYLRFRSNPLALQRVAEKTGGRVLTARASAGDIYETRREPRRSSQPVFDWFLIALACLLPLDVAVRRIQLDWRLIRGWLAFRRTGPSAGTMQTLLQRKQAVDSQLDAEREEAPVAAGPSRTEASRQERPAWDATAAARTSSEPTTTGKSGRSGQDDEESLSTTERLLERKRRRQEEDS